MASSLIKLGRWQASFPQLQNSHIENAFPILIKITGGGTRDSRVPIGYMAPRMGSWSAPNNLTHERMGNIMRQSMRLGAVGLVMAGFVGLSGVANAADVYAKGGSLKDEPVAAFMPTWAGLYVGGSVGYGWGDAENDLPATFSTEPNGAVYGVHLGYNFQRDNIVFGVEAGINGANVDDSISVPSSGISDLTNELNWYGTGVGRLGYAFGNTLLYGFGGIAWGEVMTTINRLVDEETHVGWTAGFGLEHALNNNFSVRLEYSHVDLGGEDAFQAECSTCEIDLSFDVVKAGVSYKFGSRDEALK